VGKKQKYGAYTDRMVTVAYDLPGRIKSLGYPSGLTLSYTHDDSGRVTAVNDGANDRVADIYTGWLLGGEHCPGWFEGGVRALLLLRHRAPAPPRQGLAAPPRASALPQPQVPEAAPAGLPGDVRAL